MRSGKIRHRVTLEFWGRREFEWAEDGFWRDRSDSGATPDAWATGPTIWASVEPLSGRLLLAAQEAQSDTSARIRMRWRRDVANATGKTLRLKHNGLIYRIEGRPLDVDGRRRELEVMVHEWV
ncbi:phage head closure protein [Halomonas smyrnensis]|uniref:phage head closure protein n=1 Tax=Halomonas smyrnensis TaxID=720605 RepID=UPI0002F94E87|nr:phage head closure protein [Halomonas smyrnensis]